MNNFEKAYTIFKDEGFKTLLGKVARRLWPKVNVSTTAKFNGVTVMSSTKKRLFLPSKTDSNLFTEEGVAGAHRKLTKPTDRVVTVGGGKGVTAIIASFLVGSDGKVTVYEGGYESYKTIKQTIKLNHVENTCQVIHAVVGSEVDVYGGDTSSSMRLKDIPECDVLELDCEGSEYDILQNLTIKPRVIIVEIHPTRMTDYHQEFILNQLEDLGYQIVYRSGHDGVEIDDKDLKELLYRHKKNKHGDKHQKLVVDPIGGARYPVVVAGVQKNSSPSWQNPDRTLNPVMFNS